MGRWHITGPRRGDFPGPLVGDTFVARMKVIASVIEKFDKLINLLKRHGHANKKVKQGCRVIYLQYQDYAY